MSMSMLGNPVLWAAIAIYFIYRQFTPQALKGRDLVILPLVLAYFGWRAVSSHPPTSPPVMGVFGLDATAAVAFGVARGVTMSVWQVTDGTWMRKGTAVTLALWIASIAVKVALNLLGANLVPLDDITIFLALTFGAQNLVMFLRTAEGLAVPAGVR